MAKKTVKKIVRPENPIKEQNVQVIDIPIIKERITGIENRLNRIVAALSTAKRITKDM